jgi:transglutaminase-like putative cysteine protease
MGDELNKVDDLDQFRAAAAFIDSESPGVSAFAKRAAAGADAPIDAALRLYAAVRDDIIYDPYVDFSDPSNYRASGVLAAGRGFCIGKAALFAASARSVGIPARVGYADVRNHLTSPRLRQLIGTDIFVWHSYTDIFLAGRWVKATRALRSGRHQDARFRRTQRLPVPSVRPFRTAAYGISRGSGDVPRRAPRGHPG